MKLLNIKAILNFTNGVVLNNDVVVNYISITAKAKSMIVLTFL